MLKQIKTKLGVKNAELLEILRDDEHPKLTEATLYNWDKRDNWPSWALRKCGMIMPANTQEVGE